MKGNRTTEGVVIVGSKMVVEASGDRASNFSARRRIVGRSSVASRPAAPVEGLKTTTAAGGGGEQSRTIKGHGGSRARSEGQGGRGGGPATPPPCG